MDNKDFLITLSKLLCNSINNSNDLIRGYTKNNINLKINMLDKDLEFFVENNIKIGQIIKWKENLYNIDFIFQEEKLINLLSYINMLNYDLSFFSYLNLIDSFSIIGNIIIGNIVSYIKDYLNIDINYELSPIYNLDKNINLKKLKKINFIIFYIDFEILDEKIFRSYLLLSCDSNSFFSLKTKMEEFYGEL
ncbi:hypothetical protein OF820_11955 [Oceanotoga sp. DSM 15011]|jgi:hypothetical protein|uniref:Uncharacterized protein n=1 Tax=Oceanotoga teriensis TaxID=515440 RepID=A0AA45C6F0_9BACT|nr:MULTISPECIES: hypothetical protein [Oceanotoga]MDN5343373.1 hypothetical protein [Oceanotoga sp.]MDO7975743.1 hypothetical protein [Oceanotoga teriensis]PWJ91278.1 hypothetical protein C7380_11186 [Oceanotoga teriensis]UYO99753.1 hypothetical protein OF820_11955 [Oceanotoga sp. DSM 15011]